MLIYSFHFSQFNNLSFFPEKPKFGSIHIGIYNKIIIKIIGYFWGVTNTNLPFNWLLGNIGRQLSNLKVEVGNGLAWPTWATS